MDKLALLPFFGALLYLYKSKDARLVFVNYFLPILTLIPAYYETKLITGIPEFTFWSSALIPVVIVWFFNEKMRGYKFSWLDLIILLHIIFIFYAQFEATGYKDAQKIVFRETLIRLIPYVILKAVILDEKRRIHALKSITYLAAVVSIFMLFETKFYYNFLDIYLRELWPFSVPWEGSMSRYGLKRAAGSFAHPISAGYFFSMTTPLAFWLWMEKCFKNNKYGSVVFILNALGVFTSWSRAPIAGLVLSFIIIWYGRSQVKIVSGTLLAMVMVIALSMVVPKFINYVSVERAQAENKDQENAAYR